MKKSCYILLVLALAGCAAQNSDEGTSEDVSAGSSASIKSYGSATITFKGAVNEQRSYGSSSTTNSMVGCTQSARGRFSEISLVTAKDNQDVRYPSNWLNNMSLSFTSSEIPTGHIEFDSNSRDVQIRYSPARERNSTFYILNGGCVLDISKSGSSVSMDIKCKKLRSNNDEVVEFSGHVDCSILQM